MHEFMCECVKENERESESVFCLRHLSFKAIKMFKKVDRKTDVHAFNKRRREVREGREIEN